MANCEGSTATVSSQSAKTQEITTLISRLDIGLCVSVTNGAWSGAAPQVTPQLIEQARILARIVESGIELSVLPDGDANREFADVFSELFYASERVMVALGLE